jgi:hypothetical protein
VDNPIRLATANATASVRSSSRRGVDQAAITPIHPIGTSTSAEYSGSSKRGKFLYLFRHLWRASRNIETPFKRATTPSLFIVLFFTFISILLTILHRAASITIINANIQAIKAAPGRIN